MDNDPISALLLDLDRARKDHQVASDEVRHAFGIFHDTSASSDGHLALRSALEKESGALKAYTEAMRAYREALLGK